MKTVPFTNTAPARLDSTLASLIGLSRSQVQKAIKEGRVLVDGARGTPHTLVSSANTVTYDPTIIAPVSPPLGELPPLSILYEDDDVVVLDKSAGVLSHPAPNCTEYTIADALLGRYPAMAAVGDARERAGLVHRLDRDASGVLVAAKTPHAFLALKQQFAARTTKKRYSVLVLGSVRDDAGVITFPIARAVGGGRMAARPLSQEGRAAVTHYDVVERFPHCTLLDVRIETGRTHQIRAHFFAMQHPVAGDTLYTQKGLKQFDLGRLFLHARELTVTLPSGEPTTFVSPLPPELKEVLDRLRATHNKHT